MNKSEDASSVKAIGRRKRATATINMIPGKGNIMINGRLLDKYFGTQILIEKVLSPFKLLGKEAMFDVNVRVSGGGFSGQAEAVRHAIARAFVKWNEEFRKTLRTGGMLTRDPREKERKKPGLKRARRAPQWSKR